MLTKADDYPIHQTALPVAIPATSDRNFYDRYYFNGYSRDGSVYFVMTLGVYPAINLMDAAFMIQRDGIQNSLFASRHLNFERFDSRVGPFEVQVLEPLHRILVRVGSNEHGLSCELLAIGKTKMLDEGRMHQAFGPRVLMDSMRAIQHVAWKGWIEINGDRIDVDGWGGVRDRSWGIRPIGVRDPQPSAMMSDPQIHWLWGVLSFDRHAFCFHNMDDAQGNSWHRRCSLIPQGEDVLNIRDVEVRLTYRSGTRQVCAAEILGKLPDNEPVRIEYFPEDIVYMQGAGYNHPTWGHGMYHGENALHYQTMNTKTLDPNGLGQIHLQHLSRATLYMPDGSSHDGYGILEQIMIGPHAPSGFVQFFDVAK